LWKEISDLTVQQTGISSEPEGQAKFGFNKFTSKSITALLPIIDSPSV